MMINPYGSGVLKPSRHAALVEKIDYHAGRANIPVDCVWTSLRMEPGVTQAEIDYVLGIRRHHEDGVHGLVYVGPGTNRDPIRMMELVVGAMLRNAIQARLLDISQVLYPSSETDDPMCHVLAIAGPYPAARSFLTTETGSQLTGVLGLRRMRRHQTIVHVSDFAAMESAYGPSLGAFIQKHYQRVDLA